MALTAPPRQFDQALPPEPPDPGLTPPSGGPDIRDSGIYDEDILQLSAAMQRENQGGKTYTGSISPDFGARLDRMWNRYNMPNSPDFISPEYVVPSHYDVGNSPANISSALAMPPSGVTTYPQRPTDLVNPSFTTAGGGPTATPYGGVSFASDLANHIRLSGVPDEIASQLEQRPVDFGSNYWGQGGYAYTIPQSGAVFPNGAFSLTDLLRSVLPEERLTQVVRHEAVHAYDIDHHISGSEAFHTAFLKSMVEYPDETMPFLATVPSNPVTKGVANTDWAHIYTAGFDAAGELAKIPPPLRVFYEGLLPETAGKFTVKSAK